MGNGIGTVEVKRVRDHMVIQGLGQTPRGQNFIRSKEVLETGNMASKDFKAQLEAGIRKMLPVGLFNE